MRRFASLACALALAGCSAGTTDAIGGPSGSRGVTQGGAQDIAYFRSIVARGEVPRPDTLEPVGFFAEHQVDLPPADCGDSVCVHAMLAVAPSIDHVNNWTMAFVAMNTPIDPATLERPPTHVVLVVEHTARTALATSNASTMIGALSSQLTADDLVSVLSVDASVSALASAVSPDAPELVDAANTLASPGPETGAALYDGLARASDLIAGLEGFEGAHRVVLVTSGIADAGITDQMRIVALGEALAQNRIGLSVVGVGDGYRPELAMQLSEAGGGSYYFIDQASAIEEIFRLEGSTSLFPLATGFELVVEAAPGYRVGRVYGARRAWAEQIAAHMTSPVLMLGNRTGANDTTEGRRGGGGGLFVELIADASTAGSIGADAPAFTARATWTDAASGEPVTQEIVVNNALRPGENPGGMFPSFSDPARGKAFMMLNMYLSLRATTELFQAGNCAEARGMVPAMQATYDAWQAEYADPDIDADWSLLMDLEDNVAAQCGAVEPRAPSVPMGCFYD